MHQNFPDYALSEKPHCKFLTKTQLKVMTMLPEINKILPHFSSKLTSNHVDIKLNNIQFSHYKMMVIHQKIKLDARVLNKTICLASVYIFHISSLSLSHMMQLALV